MKKYLKIIALAAVVMSLAMVSCEKDEEPIPEPPVVPENPEDTDPRAPYLGTYDMLVVYDSIGSDGVWMSNEFAYSVGLGYDPDTGFMVITTAADTNTININGTVVYADGVDSMFVPYYVTTATFDEQGRMVPQPSDFTYEAAEINSKMTYGPITIGDTLSFKNKEVYYMGSLQISYIKTIYCVKRK